MPQAQRRRVTFEWHGAIERNMSVDEHDRCGVEGLLVLAGRIYGPRGRESFWWWLVRTDDDRLFVAIPSYRACDEVLATYAADPEYIAQAVRTLCDRVDLLI